MKKRNFGVVLIVLGLIFLGAAFWLLMQNRAEEENAALAVRQAAPQLGEAIDQRREELANAPASTLPLFIQNQEPDPNREMPTTTIDGHDYVGYLVIPALELELPIMSGWSYPKLRIAPCRYSGSLYLDNLVLMAHNYKRHFGGIKDLRPGDQIFFTDLDGETVEYEVIALDVLQPSAIEDMTAGEFDLTLFTCTYGGKSRVTVRCDRVEE